MKDFQATSGGNAAQTLSSGGLAVLLALSLLILMGIDRIPDHEEPRELLARNVSVAPPPPPPPKKPQTLQKSAKVHHPQLKVSMTTSPMVLKTPPLDLKLRMELPTESSLKEMTFQADLGEVVSEALSMTFEFDDLDQPPRMVHTGGFSFTFPQDLQRRGVKKGHVMILIEIDTSGKARVISVESASHPQLVPIAKGLVSQARYAPLQVNGENVKATGIWPVHLQAPP